MSPRVPIVNHRRGTGLRLVSKYSVPTEVGTKSPAHAKKRVQMSDNAPPGGLPGQCA